jgi:outer membrane protein TolC
MKLGRLTTKPTSVWPFGLLLLLLLGTESGAQAAVLSLDDYLNQVMHTDPGYQGLVQESTAAQATSEKALLLFRPQFFTQLQYIDDTRSVAAPEIQGEKNIGRNISVGFREQTPWGMGLQLAFSANQVSLIGTDPSLVPYPAIENTYVVPQFTFSLWQNFLGRADQANQKLTAAQDLANAYGKGYQAKAKLIEAEGQYWKLAATRELARVQEESVKRARAILEYDSQKAKRHLVDPSDLLLAQAAVKGKELELHSMTDEVRKAASAFNSARAIESEDVPEDLKLPNAKALMKLQVVAREGHRGDVKAAEQASIAQSAGSDMAREKLLPELSLYGSIFAWGLNFSFPIDVGTVSSVRTGYAEQAAAADLSYQRKIIDEESEWNELTHKFAQAKEKLQIALELEDIQRDKFENVKKRRARGLTIEDQVFAYELDYLNASLARVQAEGEILGARTEMKLYSDVDRNGGDGK